MVKEHVPQHEKFGRALSAVARGVSKLQSAEICCGGLTPEQFETLRSIVTLRDPSMGTLSATMRVDLSTMSRNVSVLERQGYVSRARHRDDSRVVTVVLTRKGKNALETLRCDEKDVLAKIYQRIPSGSRAAVAQALDLLQAALEPADEANGACCLDDEHGDEPKRAAR
jgi:DNA-binding MarR family transcriptional regulator